VSPVTVVIPDILVYCYWVFYGGLVFAGGLLHLIKDGKPRENYNFKYWITSLVISLPMYLYLLGMLE
jgi:hypothetical protein